MGELGYVQGRGYLGLDWIILGICAENDGSYSILLRQKHSLRSAKAKAQYIGAATFKQVGDPVYDVTPEPTDLILSPPITPELTSNQEVYPDGELVAGGDRLRRIGA